MTNLDLDLSMLHQFFTDRTIAQGIQYQEQGRVTKLNFDPRNSTFYAQVKGSHLYRVSITMENKNKEFRLDNVCSCPMSGDCKHVVAVLLQIVANKYTGKTVSPVAKSKKSKIVSTEYEQWFTQIDQALKLNVVDQYPENVADRLVYVLNIEKRDKKNILILSLHAVRLLKNGKFSKPKEFNFQNSLERRYLLLEDKAICQLLKLMPFLASWYEAVFTLRDKQGEEILEKILKTGRCFWQYPQDQPMSLSNDRPGKFEWQLEKNGLQQLVCKLPENNSQIFRIDNLWYIDVAAKQCGKVLTTLSGSLIAALLDAPAVKPDDAKQLQELFKKRFEQMSLSLPLPQKFTQITKKEVIPIPHLHLFSDNFIYTDENYHEDRREILLAKLAFLYDGLSVDYGDESNPVTHLVKDQILSYPRNISTESKYLARLHDENLYALNDPGSYIHTPDQALQHYFVFHIHADEDQEKAHFRFCTHVIPELRQLGWKITFSDDYPFNIVEEVDEWYTRIEESSDYNWFDLELGVTVEGQTINLLPIILQLLHSQYAEHGEAMFNKLNTKKTLSLRLPAGGVLPISVERLQSILNILTELYDEKALKNGKLKLSRLRASQLLDLEAITKSKIHWFGGERVRELGQQLRNFRGITHVESPANFQAKLRPYQRDGLNWLQFLREYHLAGILADDMGLGKTVQTLAHLLIEKNQGRMDKPSLVVAPTSLMTNWRLEAEHFAPSLKVLTLHGAGRKPHFENINKYDLVLTTYPLLIRDKEALLNTDYHFLILDEAQIIKNPKAQATQIVQQFKARHRLCLTGTPLENHLGELWSLFHFLLPGLLGELAQFNKLFRIPIEKRNDADRRESLLKRVAPFMLRRTKREVVKELPDKTEIIRTIELDGPQRDLYESIRISMQQKVSQAIKNKGFANSHIIVLDALLKLRQTCCDPRLLKLETAKNAETSSAKLDYLRDVLPNLIEEGRRVLLFSQFTEMLKLIEQEVQLLKIPYVKLTGQTIDRATPIQTFQSEKVPLFLISLKAGGLGLNLTAADTVIHYDPWWNPAVETQATDRAHRIGQQKAVFVYKLITQGTVEEKILTMQQKKQALLDSLFSEQADTKTKLSVEDLEELFKPLL